MAAQHGCTTYPCPICHASAIAAADQNYNHALTEALDHLENFALTDKIEEHMEEEEYIDALRFLKRHGRLPYVII